MANNDWLNKYEVDKDIYLICGDCLKIMPKIEDKSIDLVLTDPPYIVDGKGCDLAGDRQYLKDITAANMEDGFIVDIFDRFNNWFCFCSRRQLVSLITKASVRNWNLIKWCKPNPTPLTNNNYLPDTEYIVHSFSQGRLFGECRNKSTFIVYPVEQNIYNHPTVKPLRIVKRLIINGSNKDDTILDPFMGSGTTGVACKELGRKFIGIEISEQYFKIAKQRIFNTQRSMF